MQTQKRTIVGIDEAGRGPLAGPVTACAVAADCLKVEDILRDIKDSKKLSPLKREEIFKYLKNHPGVEWGIGRVSEKVIDKINILQATKLAMRRAVKNLERKIKRKADHLLIDGNFGIDLLVSQKSIIKGDEKVFLIKLSSIIAKVTRDRLMLRYHKKYPRYQFDRHKGYGTKLHFETLRKYGPCKIHRKTFAPLRKVL